MVKKVILLAALLLTTAGMSDGGDAKKDLDRFQGTWYVVVHMNNDNKSSEEAVKKMKVVVKGQTLTISAEGERPTEISFSLDPSKSPKRVELSILPEKEIG